MARSVVLAAAALLLVALPARASSPRLRLGVAIGAASVVAGAPVAEHWRSPASAPALVLTSLGVGAVVGLASPASLTDAEAGMLGSAAMVGSLHGAALALSDRDLPLVGPVGLLVGVVAGSLVLDHVDVTPTRALVADLGAVVGAGVAAVVAARAGAHRAWILAGLDGGWLAGLLLAPQHHERLLAARPILAGAALGGLGGGTVMIATSRGSRPGSTAIAVASGAALGGLVGWLVARVGPRR